MKPRITVVLFFILCISFSVWAQVPSAHLKLWLSADSVEITDDKVSTWYDQSGNDYHLTQSNANARPAILDSALNNLPAVSFDGVDDFLSVNFETVFDQPNSIFIIWKSNSVLGVPFDNINARHFLAIGSDSKITINASNNPITTIKYPKILPMDYILNLCYFNEYDSKLYENSNLKSSGNAGNLSLEGLKLGSVYSDGAYLNGNILEVIVYDTILDSNENSLVENYLYDKYAPSVALGADITMYGFGDTSLNNANTDYHTNYAWSTGESTPEITISETDYYSVTVTNLFGVTSEDEIYVYYPEINTPPLNNTLCLYDTLIWNTGFSNNGYDFLWSDGSTDSLLNITTEGEYWVEISDTLGNQITSDTIEVLIDSFPDLNALENEYDLCTGSFLSIENGIDNIEQYQWSTGVESSFALITTAGEYSVILENSNGCVNYDTTTVSIIGTAPEVNFTFDTVCFDSETHFQDLTNSIDPIESYAWNFGDENSSDLQNPSHLYEITDTFLVSLTVNTATCVGLYTDSVFVRQIPDVSFETYWDFETTCINTPIDFVNQSNATIGTLTDFSWDFGDGNTDDDFEPSHTYGLDGDYTVELTCEQSNGCTNSASQTITIQNQGNAIDYRNLIAPANDITLETNTDVNFQWNASPNAIYYTFELATDSLFNTVIQSDDSLVNTQYVITMPAFQDSLFWRVTYVNSCFTPNASETRSINLVNLLSFTEMKLWLQSDSVECVGDTVSIIYDQSGNNYHLTQSNLNYQPHYNDTAGLNNYPAIAFDGVDDFLSVNFGDTLNQPNSIFIIWKSNSVLGVPFDNINARHFLAIGSDSKITINASNNPTTTIKYSKILPMDYILNSCYFNENDSKLYENSNLKSSGNVGDLSLEGLKLGSIFNGGVYLNGNILEVIVYDTILDSNENSLVESYFYDKYTPPVNLGADITMYGFADTSLVNANTEYHTNYVWSTGETTPEISVSETGTYSITVANLFGITSEDEIYVHYPEINMPPQSNIVCLGDTLIWNTKFSNDEYNFLWSDGSTDSLLNITTEGEYWVEVTDTLGYQITSDTIEVLIDSFPDLNALENEYDLCTGSFLSIEDGIDDIEQYQWNTGSEDSLTLITTAGEYSIILENSNGCVNFDTTTVSIIGTAPEVNFTFDTVCFDSETHFQDLTNSIDPIESYAWNFGDENSSDLQNPSHLYEITDTFLVSLTVNTATCVGLYTDSVFVRQIPDVSFETYWDFETTCTNTPIDFVNQSNATIGTLTDFSWDFGDGNTDDDFEPSHTYGLDGDYTVELTCEQSNGCTNSAMQTINIETQGDAIDYRNLIAPANNITQETNTNINFQWNTAPNAIYYRFELATDSLFNTLIHSADSLDNTNYLVNMPTTQDSLFWRVTYLNSCFTAYESEIRSINLVNLSSFAEMKLWLQSDSVERTNDSVSILYDLSGNNDHLAQSNLNYQPHYNDTAGLNNYPAIAFDGVDDFLSVNFGDTLNQPNSIFIIWKSNSVLGVPFDNINARHFLAIGSDSKITINASNNPTTTIKYSKILPMDYILNSCYFNENDSKLYENSNLKSSGNVGDLSLEGLKLGSIFNGGVYLNGNIMEVIVYDTILANNKRILVENYFYSKYAPPVNLGYDIDVPYGFCDTTITTADKPWFTDYLWSTGDTTATISTNHNGEYSVTVTDIFGFTSTDDIRVNFPRVYQANALSMVCDGDTLVWDTGLPTESYNFNWLNSTSTQAYAGYWQNQQAAVQITDTNGCSFFTDTVDIMLDMFEHTAALGDGDTALCIGNRLTLANGFDEAVTFLWQDGSTEPEYLIETAGTYHVTVSNALGCTARDTIDVSILGTVPEPDFTVSGQCAEASIQLNDASSSADGNIISWEWSTNNEIFATGESSSISFDSMGIYDIQLEIFTDVGCHQTISQSIQIHPLPEPDFSPLSVCSNQPIILQNLSSIPQGNMQSSEWQFGSGSDWISADMQAIMHEFANAGMHAVSLSVTSEDGCEKQISKQVEVRQSPQAAFSTSPRCDGEAVIFWNQTDAQGTQLWEYQWNFGDGNNSTASDPQHLYPNTGNYTVDMSVKSLNGCTDTASMTITVYSLPQAAVENLNACLGVAHQLADITDASAGAIVAREWQVAGLQLTGENPSIQLDSLGSYPLTLHVTTEYGCTSQIDTLLMVRENPDADFELPQTWGAVPLSLNLENTSLGGDSYIWHFGDGESANDENPQHVWQDSGNYKIQLIAVSPYGCTDSLSKNLRVIIPLVDVGIIALQTEMADNYLQVSADIINPGTVPITGLALELDPGNGEITREILPNEFAEGAVMRYTFNSQPYFASGKLPEYICVSLDPGVPDDVPENNQLCNLHDAGFSLQSMYPNPVNDLLNLHVVLPRDGNLQVQVFDAVGQQVKSLNLELNSGYHALALDCASLSSGRYQVRLSFEDEEIYKGFIK